MLISDIPIATRADDVAKYVGDHCYGDFLLINKSYYSSIQLIRYGKAFDYIYINLSKDGIADCKRIVFGSKIIESKETTEEGLIRFIEEASRYEVSSTGGKNRNKDLDDSKDQDDSEDSIKVRKRESKLKPITSVTVKPTLGEIKSQKHTNYLSSSTSSKKLITQKEDKKSDRKKEMDSLRALALSLLEKDKSLLEKDRYNTKDKHIKEKSSLDKYLMSCLY